MFFTAQAIVNCDDLIDVSINESSIVFMEPTTHPFGKGPITLLTFENEKTMPIAGTVADIEAFLNSPFVNSLSDDDLSKSNVSHQITLKRYVKDDYRVNAESPDSAAKVES